ncbi:hypothetical protein EV127DRAFT_476487 [Xylaria flabelliformis]|nr:hypothetical protein EV127DRAFT_476487 [Xylaria flabelliformis]
MELLELQKHDPAAHDHQHLTSIPKPYNNLSPERRDDANDEPEAVESVDEEVAASFANFMYESIPHDALFDHSHSVFFWYRYSPLCHARGVAYTWAKNEFPKPSKPMLTPPDDNPPHRFRDICGSRDLELVRPPLQGQICIISSRSLSDSAVEDLISFIRGFVGLIQTETAFPHFNSVFERLIHEFVNPNIRRTYRSMVSQRDAVYVLRYNIHYFIPCRYEPLTIEPGRQIAKLSGTYFIEKMSSLLLVCSETPGRPYTIITLADSRIYFPTEEEWKMYGLIPCGTENGVTQFLAMILLLVDECEKEWMSAMDSMDSIVRVQLGTFYHEEVWEHLMFDESFKLSKDYFSILQLLRILTDWIDSTENDFMSLRRGWLSLKEQSSSPKIDLDIAEKNWNTALEIMKRRTETVRTSAARKAEEIKSLRDGLFNATSLREATRSMTINRAIYVFTIITVIYTPVEFLATFWALPFLNNPSENGTVPIPAAFRNTFIIIPLLTYGFAILIAVYFSSETVKRVTQRALRGAIRRITSWL